MIIFDLCCTRDAPLRGWFRPPMTSRSAAGEGACLPVRSAVLLTFAGCRRPRTSGDEHFRAGRLALAGAAGLGRGALAVLKAVVDRVVAKARMSAGPLPKRPEKIHYHESPHGRSRITNECAGFAELQEELMSSVCPIPVLEETQ